MLEKDEQLTQLLDQAVMDIAPNPDQMQSVRDRMIQIAHRPASVNRRYRIGMIILFFSIVFTAAGLATTRAGWDFIVNLFTPIHTSQVVTWQAPDGHSTFVRGAVSLGRDASLALPVPPAKQQEIKTEFKEIYEIALNGGGRLIGLFETPEFTVYQVEYTLTNSKTSRVGGNTLTEKQAQNMRITEIMKLRDAGAGTIIIQKEFPIGLGLYTLRFTLSDGQTIDLQTYYPPAPRKDRDAIFTETRALKKQLKFFILDADRIGTTAKDPVYGTIRYKLSDGRSVGIKEQIPVQLISPDGQYVINPENQEKTTIGSSKN